VKFDITKRLDLGFIGEEWKDCYIDFSLPSYADIKDFANTDGNEGEAVEKGLDKLVELFKKGKGIADGKTVDILAKDIKDMPMEIINKALKLISGEIDPKENGNSTTV